MGNKQFGLKSKSGNTNFDKMSLEDFILIDRKSNLSYSLSPIDSIVNKPFYEKEYPTNKKVEHDFTCEDIKNLKFEEEIVEIKKDVIIYNISNDCLGLKGFMNVGSQQYEIYFPLNKKSKKDFLKKYDGYKKLLVNIALTYNTITEKYYAFNLGIYSFKNPLDKWIALMENKSLKEKVDTLLSILGFKYDSLLYHEKVTHIIRLIPLVVKKFLYVELSKKELGKSHTYSSLDYNLYTLLLTRSTMFVDGRNSTKGDFFEENTAFVVDEINKITDTEVITALQVYMNGNKKTGEIQSNGNNKMISSISPILLGNTKVEVDFNNVFNNRCNLFEKTKIMESPDGEAFISRINSLPNSWGCRPISKNMINDEKDFYYLSLLKEVIPILRELKIDIDSDSLRLSDCFGIRGVQSIEKNLEGWIKLLYPEYISNTERIPTHEFKFMLERAIEVRITVENQLNIINPSGNKINSCILNSDFKGLIVEDKNEYHCTPHHIFINKGNGIQCTPLDIIGIEYNNSLIDRYPNIPKDGDSLILPYSFNNNRIYKDKWDVIQNHLTGSVENCYIHQYIFY